MDTGAEVAKRFYKELTDIQVRPTLLEPVVSESGGSTLLDYSKP